MAKHETLILSTVTPPTKMAGMDGKQTTLEHKNWLNKQRVTQCSPCNS